MNLTIHRTEALTLMQANRTPEELASFVEMAGLTEVPVIVGGDDDVLADLDVSDAVAQ